MRAARMLLPPAVPSATVAASSVPSAILPKSQCRATTLALPTLYGLAPSRVQPLGVFGAVAVPSYAVCKMRISPASTTAGQAGDRAALLVSVETPAPADLKVIAIYMARLLRIARWDGAGGHHQPARHAWHHLDGGEKRRERWQVPARPIISFDRRRKHADARLSRGELAARRLIAADLRAVLKRLQRVAAHLQPHDVADDEADAAILELRALAVDLLADGGRRQIRAQDVMRLIRARRRARAPHKDVNETSGIHLANRPLRELIGAEGVDRRVPIELRGAAGQFIAAAIA